MLHDVLCFPHTKNEEHVSTENRSNSSKCHEGHKLTRVEDGRETVYTNEGEANTKSVVIFKPLASFPSPHSL